MIWSHEAEAKMRGIEIRSGQRDVVQSNMFLACIVATPEANKMREFAGENSFCGRYSKMMK